MDHWMVSVKFALKDAPDIGNGRWTWPLNALSDMNLIEKIIKRGILVQENINILKQRETNQEETNPQTLWEDFKSDIQKIVKNQSNKT